MTPATYRAGGAGEQVRYVTTASALGRLIVAGTKRGVCFVALGDGDAGLATALAEEFPAASKVRGDSVLVEWAREVVERVAGHAPSTELPLDIRATAFQRRVWEELRRIPIGKTLTYSQVARKIGKPKAVRAVASACARNNVAVVIPCHRVVRTDGGLGGYRWGVERKKQILKAESAG